MSENFGDFPFREQFFFQESLEIGLHIQMAEETHWRITQGDSKHIVVDITDAAAPNMFHRAMQRLFFGFKYTRKE